MIYQGCNSFLYLLCFLWFFPNVANSKRIGHRRTPRKVFSSRKICEWLLLQWVTLTMKHGDGSKSKKMKIQNMLPYYIEFGIWTLERNSISRQNIFYGMLWKKLLLLYKRKELNLYARSSKLIIPKYLLYWLLKYRIQYVYTKLIESVKLFSERIQINLRWFAPKVIQETIPVCVHVQSFTHSHPCTDGYRYVPQARYQQQNIPVEQMTTCVTLCTILLTSFTDLCARPVIWGNWLVGGYGWVRYLFSSLYYTNSVNGHNLGLRELRILLA